MKFFITGFAITLSVLIAGDPLLHPLYLGIRTGSSYWELQKYLISKQAEATDKQVVSAKKSRKNKIYPTMPSQPEVSTKIFQFFFVFIVVVCVIDGIFIQCYKLGYIFLPFSFFIFYAILGTTNLIKR